MRFDETIRFNAKQNKEPKKQANEIQILLKDVYDALEENGYNPINQIMLYILSGDPTYITNHNDARNKIRTIEREELLEKLIRYYIGIEK